MHKATYKHSRGKSGRYTRQIVHVKKFQRIHAFLTHLGYNINMCGQHRFFNRFLCAFNILCNNISYTYGFRFNRRAREKLVK